MSGPLQLHDYILNSYAQLAAHAKGLIPKWQRRLIDENDVAQEAVLNLLAQSHRYVQLDSNRRRAYARVTVRQIVLRQFRRSASEERAKVEWARITSAESSDRPPRKEVAAKLLDLIERLPAGQYDALHAVYVDGLTPEKASRGLHITRNALDQRLHNGVARLRATFMCPAHGKTSP